MPASVVFQCRACRTLASAAAIAFDAEGSRAGLTCDACMTTTWLPLAGARRSDVVDVKDARVQPSALAATPSAMVPTSTSAPVAASFFSVDQRERIEARLRVLPTDGDVEATFAQRFHRLLDHWYSEAEHKRLLKQATIDGCLGLVGQRYRVVLEEAPGDASAKFAQNEILTLAMGSMTQRKDIGSVDGGKRAGKTALAAVVAFALAACLAMVWAVPKLLRSVSGSAMIRGPAVGE